jgi:hypothetical protein
MGENENQEETAVSTLADAASKGGKAAAANMTPEALRERAKKAAAARWTADLPHATHGSPDRPLMIGDISIPCYVVQEGEKVMRVIVQAGMIQALGMVKGGSSAKGGTRLAKFTSQDRLKSFVSEDLIRRTQSPIRFVTTGGTLALGFEADILAELCEAVIEAKNNDTLTAKQMHIAERCWILIKGFARVGIDALVDEATGYQFYRPNDELRKILERYISKELAKWVLTFQPDFYRQMYRLRKWELNPDSHRKPGAVAKYTINLVYNRIHPELLRELKQTRSDWEGSGGSKGGKLFQFLTVDAGHPRLKQHIEGVIQIMRFSRDWATFMYRMDVAYPEIGKTPRFSFPTDDDDSPST